MFKEETWRNSIRRESKIRRGIIIYGNIQDIFFNKSKRKYDTLIGNLKTELKNNGFKEVVVWDKSNGISKEELDEVYLKELYESSIEDEGFDGEKYELSDDVNYESNKYSIDSLDELLPVIHNSMIKKTDKKTAFILDWSNYLFGNSNSLTESDRKNLTLLSKIVRDGIIGTGYEEIEKPDNIVILIAPKDGDIPSSFYRDNPAVKSINISIPSRDIREDFIIRNKDKFKIKENFERGSKEVNDFVDSMDGFTLKDHVQIMKLSRVVDEELSFDKLLNLYKYGEKRSPWEDLSRDKIKTIREVLKQRVKGQDEAIEKVEKVVKNAFTGLSGIEFSNKKNKPKGTLFFVGPTGVGKTELAKALAQFLFGDEDACIRFDMSEFNHEHSDQRLIGAPPGYVGYEEGGQLTNAIKARPFSVILFDEIEKAHGKILDKFLQILEDGRLTDGRGETVSFSESIIIFTSNIGAAEIDFNATKDEIINEFKKKVQEHFIKQLKRPELLNRLGDNIIVFNHIKDNNFMKEIARGRLRTIEQFMKDRYGCKINISDEDKVLDCIISSTNISNGGRGVLNSMKKVLTDELSEFVFEEKEELVSGSIIEVRIINDRIKYELI